MANERSTTASSAQSPPPWMREHLPSYLASGGTRGHIMDFRSVGGHWLTPHLLLKTVGRKTGVMRVVPLIYGVIGGEAAIVASKGGADTHPGWYINIRNSTEVEMQIATQAYRATWREPRGAERKTVWDYMVTVYPPYAAYQAKTRREIPLVLLKPTAETAIFR
jgi:deazaflavin-dependent oxidoreductase (nitroreductase family)